MSRPALWKPFIVVASYAFYAAANWTFCFLLGGVTMWNQGAARLIHRTEDERRRKLLVGFAVAGNLIVLGVFKYYSFFVQDVDRALDAIRLGLPLPLLTVVLPVGVSFFTFQAISYTVDVHRRVIEPASLLDAAIYLSFFPHLVAGPIVRAREFLPQLTTPRDPSRVPVGAGVSLIALGLIKKVVIADYLARTVVDPVFAVPQSYSAPDAALAAYAYTAQIYCDFSGYTDIAIGLALLMGFVFPQNFDRPYRSLGVREFWRRWHMTLSRFLRDFLYIPLGGNRGKRGFVYRNLLITMVLGGLWHGAAWTFVLWGGLHGSALCVEHAFSTVWERVPKWVRWSVTFNFVVVAWIFFRSQSIGDAWTFLGRLFTPGSPTLWAFTPVALAACVIAFQLLPPRPLERVRLRFERLNPALLGTALAVVILVVGATVPSQGVAPFIYFRF
ncbi:MAG: alginate O-acetyltransferase complex protein AlgI [Thermoleophilaceae bacterium]|jgi:D-alanyl-lipoteichoic acid acyltransferase DltB (MBOAT superfamily)|nr:alginate O-acetyltransferase complex protein AlgI [Thermoleophilaceae bacterium]